MGPMDKLALAAALTLTLAAAGMQPADVGQTAPDFEGEWTNFDGTTLHNLQGRVVFIEFWRTW